MFISIARYLTLLFLFTASYCSAEALCCGEPMGCFDVGVGWRRDTLKWHAGEMHNDCIDTTVSSKMKFNKMDLYFISAKAKIVDCSYYTRFSADYGRTEKGRLKEHFAIESPLIINGFDEITVENPVKRRSEVYDFSGAVGYPFKGTNCCWYVVPLVGFSYHRQRIRVKEDNESSSFSSNSFFIHSRSESESESELESEGILISDFSENPFGSREDECGPETIAEFLGLETEDTQSQYRFTWYGFYVGVDAAIALDDIWTIYGEFEGHFLNKAHRKRNSLTGVDFVDEWHRTADAYGYNTTIGTAFAMSACWYGTLAIDYKWWKSHAKHDDLKWKSVSMSASIGYNF